MMELTGWWKSLPACELMLAGRKPSDARPVSGFLCFDAFGSVVEIVLNQGARLAHSLIPPLYALLTPLHIVVSLGVT